LADVMGFELREMHGNTCAMTRARM
jgi:hypothetical protein